MTFVTMLTIVGTKNIATAKRILVIMVFIDFACSFSPDIIILTTSIVIITINPIGMIMNITFNIFSMKYITLRMSGFSQALSKKFIWYHLVYSYYIEI